MRAWILATSRSKGITGMTSSRCSTKRSALVRATAPRSRWTPCSNSEAVIAAIASSSSSSSRTGGQIEVAALDSDQHAGVDQRAHGFDRTLGLLRTAVTRSSVVR